MAEQTNGLGRPASGTAGAGAPDPAQAPAAGQETLADVEHAVVEAAVALGHALRTRGWTIACAESCTGGLVCRALTEIGG